MSVAQSPLPQAALKGSPGFSVRDQGAVDLVFRFNWVLVLGREFKLLFFRSRRVSTQG